MKKASYFTCAFLVALASASCDAQNGKVSSDAQPQSELPAVPRPADGDWSKVVSQTREGGFLMGDPRANVRLVEFGSLTCDECKEFDETGVTPLIDKYVKTGRVGYEFRNYVRDGLDLTAALIVRCNGPKTFFPLERALYEEQEEWIAKVQQTPQQKLAQLQNLPPEQQFVEFAKAAGLQEWAAKRGLPLAKSTQCLKDQNSVNQLIQMAGDTTREYPEFKGTPSFVLNGKLLEDTHTWNDLEPKLAQALGERG